MLVGFTFAASLPLLLPFRFANNDLFFQWYTGHLLSVGQSPYNAHNWELAQVVYASDAVRRVLAAGLAAWPYPPWTGYLFLPFGALSESVGLWLQHLVYAWAALFAGFLLLDGLRARLGRSFEVAAALTISFAPLLLATHFGQFSTLLLLGVALLVVGFERSRPMLIVGGSLLLATKPHVVAVLAVVVVALLIERRAWRTLTIATTTIGAIIVIAAVTQPEAFDVMIRSAHDRFARPEWFASTWSFSLGLTASGSAWLPLSLGLVIVSGLACAMAIRISSPPDRARVAIAAGCVASLALTPNVYEYDHILLVPTIALLVVAAESLAPIVRAAFLVVLIGVVCALPWLMFLLGTNEPGPGLSGTVPLVFAVALLFAARRLQQGLYGLAECFEAA